MPEPTTECSTSLNPSFNSRLGKDGDGQDLDAHRNEEGDSAWGSVLFGDSLDGHILLHCSSDSFQHMICI